MFPTDLDSSPILKDFYQFYAALVAEKNRALSPSFLERQFQDVPEVERPREMVRFFSGRLCDVLEEQALRVTHEAGEFVHAYYKEAQYLMAALADEIFLHLDWPGQALWDTCLVETRLFQSHIAGTKVFTDLISFLEKRDPLLMDLAAIYFLVLGLGFRGQYFDQEDGGRIEDFKKRLYLFATREEAALFARKRTLFPQTYSHTLDTGDVRTLVHPRIWYTAYISMVVLCLGLGTLAWYQLTGPLAQITDQIIALGLRQGGS